MFYFTILPFLCWKTAYITRGVHTGKQCLYLVLRNFMSLISASLHHVRAVLLLMQPQQPTVSASCSNDKTQGGFYCEAVTGNKFVPNGWHWPWPLIKNASTKHSTCILTFFFFFPAVKHFQFFQETNGTRKRSLSGLWDEELQASPPTSQQGDLYCVFM